METTNHIAYDIDKSSQRMDDILEAETVIFLILILFRNGHY